MRKAKSSGFRVWVLGCRVQGLGLRVEGLDRLGLQVGLWFRVWGLGFGV